MMQFCECRCKRYARVATMMVVAAWSLGAQTTTGSMAGTVTGPDGTALTNVIVTYLLPPTQSSPQTTGALLTDANGQFQASNLPAGLYYLCAYPVPRSGFLETCAWTRNTQTATIVAGQSTTVPITLQKGQRLHVRVNDPKQILAISATGRTGTPLMLGIWEPAGFYHSLPMRSFDATGQDFELAVPTAMSFHPTLAAQNAQITDSTGAAVMSQGAGLSLQIPSGTSFQQWTFTVQPTATVPVGTQQKKASQPK